MTISWRWEALHEEGSSEVIKIFICGQRWETAAEAIRLSEITKTAAKLWLIWQVTTPGLADAAEVRDSLSPQL